jgi:hypothetical protein
MVELLVILVFAGGLLFWVVFSLRRRPEPPEPPEQPAAFVCSNCGEKHCDCHPDRQPGERSS